MSMSKKDFIALADGHKENIGYLCSVSESEARASESYTWNPKAGFFITKKARQGY